MKPERFAVFSDIRVLLHDRLSVEPSAALDGEEFVQ